MKTYFLDVLLHHYADFSGKTTRKQYWMFVLWCFICSLVLFVFTLIFTKIGLILIYLFSLALIVPHVSIFVRRVRDAGHNIYWGLLLVPWALTVLAGFLPQSIATDQSVHTLLSLLGALSLFCCIVALVFCLLPSRESL